MAYVRPDLDAQRRAIEQAPLLAAAFPDIVLGHGEPDAPEDDAIYITLDADDDQQVARGF